MKAPSLPADGPSGLTKMGMFSSFVKPPISSNHWGWVKWCRVHMGSIPLARMQSMMAWNLRVQAMDAC